MQVSYVQQTGDGADPHLTRVFHSIWVALIAVSVASRFGFRTEYLSIALSWLPLLMTALSLTIPRRPHEYDFKFDNRLCQEMWEMESVRLRRVFNRGVQAYAALYSFLVGMVLLASTHILLTSYKSGALTAKVPVLISSAALAATVVSFAVDLGQAARRAAVRDLTSAMLAWVIKRYLSVLCGTALGVIFLYVAANSLTNAGDVGKLASAATLGAIVAVYGERATAAISERAALTFGMKLTILQRVVALKEISALDEPTIERLAEEEIHSIHSLAFYSTPRLFFATPYPLAKVCDLQDQAGLICELGSRRAQVLDEQFAVRGIIAASEFASALVGAKEELKDVQSALGLTNEFHTRCLLKRLSESPLAASLKAYRSGMPKLSSPRSAPPNGEPARPHLHQETHGRSDGAQS